MHRLRSDLICIKPAPKPWCVRTVCVSLVAFDSCTERRYCICIHHRFKMASRRSKWRGQRWEDWISLPITAAWPPRSAVQKHLITKTNYPSGKCITVTTQGLTQEDQRTTCVSRCVCLCITVHSVCDLGLCLRACLVWLISAWPLMFADLLTLRGQCSVYLSLHYLPSL